jgi:hypothetical protein
MNTKTVESSVYRLRQESWIVDTGKRAGDTRKVVVYRLNDPNTGVITQRPQTDEAEEDASAARAQMAPETVAFTGLLIPPNPTGNPPKSDVKRPQKVEETTPKQGVRIRNGTRKEPGKESGLDAACAALPEVPSDVLRQWLPVRKEKRAGPVTDLVAAALRREAEKAGLTPADAVRYCCEVGWQNFNAGFYAKRENAPVGRRAQPQRSFRQIDYSEGVTNGIPDA